MRRSGTVCKPLEEQLRTHWYIEVAMSPSEIDTLYVVYVIVVRMDDSCKQKNNMRFFLDIDRKVFRCMVTGEVM